MNGQGTIRAGDLRKRDGDLVAVDGVSLDLKRGETFGLLGPNGPGKTTTLLMLVGALRPDGGEILFDGEPDPTWAEGRRRASALPRFFMPSWLLSISHISPFRWGIVALECGTWRAFSLAKLLPSCGVLLGVGLVCYLAGVVLLRRFEA